MEAPTCICERHELVVALLGEIVDTLGKRVCWTVLCIPGKGRNVCYTFGGWSNGILMIKDLKKSAFFKLKKLYSPVPGLSSIF